MATILEIIQANTDDIRNRTLPGSITRTNDANLRDTVAIELRERGVLRAADTTALALVSTDNTKLVVVKNVGLFQALASGAAPNGVTTFDTPEPGFLWEKVLSVPTSSVEPERITVTGDHDYVLTDGFMIDKIMMNPDNADPVKVGLTDGGEEIMFLTTLAANQWNIITRDIVADGGAVTIYFVGFSADAELIFYKRSLT